MTNPRINLDSVTGVDDSRTNRPRKVETMSIEARLAHLEAYNQALANLDAYQTALAEHLADHRTADREAEIAEASQRQQSANNPLTDAERQLAARHAATARYEARQELDRISTDRRVQHAKAAYDSTELIERATEHPLGGLPERLRQYDRDTARREALEDALDIAADLDAARTLAEYNHYLIEQQIKAHANADERIALHNATKSADEAAKANLHSLDVAAHTEFSPTTNYCHRGHELVPENVIDLIGDPEHPQRLCKSCRETYAALPESLRSHWNG
jgi:hypothetical protein